MYMDPRPKAFESAFQEYATVITIMLVQTFNQFGTNLTMPLMNVLEDSFTNATSNDKVWFMAAFPLTAGTFILISGKFGDLYGLKKVLLYGTVWSFIWTLIAGLSIYSKSVEFFCVARGLQGIGLAFMLPTAIGVAGSLYPPGQRKATVFCLVSACAPFGATISAIVGGVFAHYNLVQWAFYSNALCFAVIGAATYYFIPFVPLHVPEEGEDEPSMDWIGAALGVVGLILFNFAFNQAPAAGWGNPYIIVMLILGILFVVAFAYVEGRVKQPILPKQVMNAHVGIILGVVALGWSSFSIWVFYYWSLVLNLNNYNPIIAGVTYLTLMTCGFIAAGVVGLFIRKVRPSYILIGSSIAFLIGIAMLSGTGINQSYWHMVFPQMIILSFGMDMSFPAASLILSDNLPKKHQGMASSLVSTTVNYSTSIALGLGAIAEVKVHERTQNVLKSYRAAMYVGIGLAGLGLLLSLALHLWSYRSHDTEKPKAEEASEENHYSGSIELDTHKL